MKNICVYKLVMFFISYRRTCGLVVRVCVWCVSGHGFNNIGFKSTKPKIVNYLGKGFRRHAATCIRGRVSLRL